MDIQNQISSLLQEIVAGVEDANQKSEKVNISFAGGPENAGAIDFTIDPYRGGVGVSFKVNISN